MRERFQLRSIKLCRLPTVVSSTCLNLLNGHRLVEGSNRLPWMFPKGLQIRKLGLKLVFGTESEFKQTHPQEDKEDCLHFLTASRTISCPETQCDLNEFTLWLVRAPLIKTNWGKLFGNSCSRIKDFRPHLVLQKPNLVSDFQYKR
jgi:hypothetical protein